MGCAGAFNHTWKYISHHHAVSCLSESQSYLHDNLGIESQPFLSFEDTYEISQKHKVS
jgi:hypothetical protein